MNKVEKIKAEIERRYEYWKEKDSNSHSIESESRMSECNHLLSMIISLSDTEKDFGIKTKFKVGDTIRNKQWPTACHTIESIDSEFYYLDNGGKVEIAHQDLWELEEEPVSNDLEEAAMQYAKSKHKDTTLQQIVSWDFKAGALWQKEKIIAKACEWLENYFKGVSSGTVYLEDFKKAIKE